MKQLFGAILSPMAFCLGFLWPLASQSAIALELVAPGWTAVALGAALAIPFGLMAQFRGSWIWIK